MKAELKVLFGSIALQTVEITGVGRTSFKAKTVRAGKKVNVAIK